MEETYSKNLTLGCELELLLGVGIRGFQISDENALRLPSLQSLLRKDILEKRDNNLYLLSKKGKEIYETILGYSESLLR